MSPQWSPQQLSPQWLFGNSRTWTHDVRLHIASTNEPKRVLNKLSKEHNISGHKWPMTYRVLEFNRSKMSVIYLLSWKQCALRLSPQWPCGNSCTWAHDVVPLSCYDATHVLGHMIYHYHVIIIVIMLCYDDS